MRANPFDVGSAEAATYARARPYYHPLALDRAFDLIGEPSIQVGLDVGCGTGLSSRALADRVAKVIAIDPSASMLSVAQRPRSAVFARAMAENLPVGTARIGVATCAASMHWFSEAAFAELARVVRPGGHVVVYSDFFLGELADAALFHEWMQHYLARLPTPPRADHYDEPAMEAVKLRLIAHEQRTYEVPMTRHDLAEYLMTQSNATSAIHSGVTTSTALRDWISAELTQLLPDQSDHLAKFGYQL